MRRIMCLGAGLLILGASVDLGSVSRADTPDTPESLLQYAAKQHKYCKEPRQFANRKAQSSDFDSCNDESETLIKAIELSKNDPKIVEAATPPLTAARLNMAQIAVILGHIYIMREDLGSAVGFFGVACNPFKGVPSVVKPTPEQIEVAKATTAEAGQLLQGDHRSCKELDQP